MKTATDHEQLMLELINYTRMDPMGAAGMYIKSYAPLVALEPDIQRALDFFNVSGNSLQTAFLTLSSVQPVAWNAALSEAAYLHSAEMIRQDSQEHVLPNELGVGERLSDAGYNWRTAGENIYAYSYNMLYAMAGFMVDWGYGKDGMQDPAGHRISIMNANFREVGIGVITESSSSTHVGPYVVTQDFATAFNSPDVFVLGVAFNDKDKDKFYSVGEGIQGVDISIMDASAKTADSGGYVLQAAAGQKSIRISAESLATDWVVSANLLAGSNVKLDILDAKTLLTSTSLSIISGLSSIKALGLSDIKLTGSSAKDHLTGNAGKNWLFGKAGNDTLDGGAGADTMLGGSGNDIYYVDNKADRVFETTTTSSKIDAGGIDKVIASISYTLGNFVENLTLTGAGKINGTGNSLNNIITGNSGNNTLNGLSGNDKLNGGAGNDLLIGGLGKDTLTGGAGKDSFRFNTKPSSSDVDTITDFNVKDDTIQLENSILTAFGSATGKIQASQLRANTTGKAQDSNDYVVYNKTTGEVYYDADGNGAGVSVQIALIGKSLALTNADFVLV